MDSIVIDLSKPLCSSSVVGLDKSVSVGSNKLFHSLIQPSPILIAAWILQNCRINAFETMCPRFRDYEWNLRLADGPHYLLVDGQRISRFDNGISRAIMLLELRHDDEESLITRIFKHKYQFDFYDHRSGQFEFEGDACFDIISFEPC
jgi:hypothetical protein